MQSVKSEPLPIKRLPELKVEKSEKRAKLSEIECNTELSVDSIGFALNTWVQRDELKTVLI